MFRILITAWTIVFLSACGAPEPGEPVDDPKTYLINHLRELKPRGWWAEYANKSDEFLETVVDDFAESLRAPFPNDSKQLDRLARRLAGRYSSMTISEPHRDYIMKQAQLRFENPPMAIVGTRSKVGLLDFHLVPGEWGSAGRGSEVIKNSPAIEGIYEFDHDVFVTALNKVATKFPELYTYQIRAKFYSGASPFKLTFQVSRDGRIVKRSGVYEAYTRDKVDWDKLIAGEIRLDSLEWDHPMEGSPGPGFSFVHADPLPYSSPDQN